MVKQRKIYPVYESGGYNNQSCMITKQSFNSLTFFVYMPGLRMYLTSVFLHGFLMYLFVYKPVDVLVCLSVYISGWLMSL